MLVCGGGWGVGAVVVCVCGVCVSQVLASRSNVKFAIVGDGYMRADLERRVHELGISAAVRWQR